jgi:hypothetical protein
MKEEHGLELEKIKAQQRGELTEFTEAAAVGGGRVYAIRQTKVEEKGEKTPSPRSFYDIVQRFNETIKNWKGT